MTTRAQTKNKRTVDGQILVADHVVELLSRLECSGNVARIPRAMGQIDRKLYTSLDAILSAMGGKWTRSVGGHVFPAGADVASLVESVVETGSCKDPRAGDFFETPEPLARRLVEMAGIEHGHSVLEPSAGRGAISREIAWNSRASRLRQIERDPNKLSFLPHMPSQGITFECADFLTVRPDEKVDRVVMNSPFSRQQDVDHVTHAISFLKPDGRLVGVVGAGVKYRDNAKGEAFRALLRQYAATIDDLPADSFASSGTRVRACVVVVDASRNKALY